MHKQIDIWGMMTSSIEILVSLQSARSEKRDAVYSLLAVHPVEFHNVQLIGNETRIKHLETKRINQVKIYNSYRSELYRFDIWSHPPY
jgi:hypothetical protein